MLGHTVPTTLKQLKELTNIDYNTVDVSDPYLYKVLNDITELGTTPEKKLLLKQNPLKTCSNGLPELSTKFLSSMIQQLKPECYSDIVAIEGLSHGTNVWNMGQQDSFRAGLITKDELFSTREDLTKMLTVGGLKEEIAFKLVEKIRKGKTLLKEEIELIHSTSLKKEVIKNILKISYLFPIAHAESYGLSAMQILWFKVYQPTAFYSVMLTQYGSDVNDFDYFEVMDCESLDSLKRLYKKYEIGQNQKVVIKFKTRLADLLFEAKLRGYTIKKPNLYSHPTMFTPNPKNEMELLMPLSSLAGVAELTAKKIYDSLKEKEYEDYNELISRKDSNGRAIFNKTTLEALNLYQLQDWEIESFNNEMNFLKMSIRILEENKRRKNV